MGLSLANAYVFADQTLEAMRWKPFFCEVPNNGSNNLSGFGCTVTQTGSTGAESQASTNYIGRILATAAVSGTSAGALLDAQHSNGHFLAFSCNLKTSTVSTVRYFVGFSDTNVAGMVGTTATPTQNYMGFRFASGSDTNWIAVCDNASGTPATVDTGVAVSAGGRYLLGMSWDRDQRTAYFFVNNLFKGSISTKLPATSVVTLALQTGIATNTTAVATLVTYFANGRSRTI